MARKFYTCIIVPDASQRLHKLRVAVPTLYVLSIIGAVSFFVAVALGFNYVAMASRVAASHGLQCRERVSAKRSSQRAK